MNQRERLKNKKRIVIKVGSSSLHHPETEELDLTKVEVLVREICDLRNQGKDVVLVSSGAIAVGRKAIGMAQRPSTVQEKQACAAVGQAKLMMIYQKIFAEYDQTAGQVLMTKNTMLNNWNRKNAQNTFEELLNMGVVPVVNENDTVATYEIEFGDNDTLSAIVAALIGADLLILLSDIDGLFSDDPRTNKEAKFIDIVEEIDEELFRMGKGTTGSSVGTGGMATKLSAATVATSSGADMVIANGDDFHVIHKIVQGRNHGTLFLANPEEDFFLLDYLEKLEH